MIESRVNTRGRPWGVPRCCVNKHGEPKPRLFHADAVAKALVYDYERQTDLRRRARGPVQAYECPFCGWWHIGTRRRKLRPTIQRIELGDRVWWNLQAENRGRTEHRVRTLTRRGKRRGREAVSSRALRSVA